MYYAAETVTVALGVFEDGIGPDRISDITVSVILPDLLAFNERVLPLRRRDRGGRVQDAVLTRQPLIQFDDRSVRHG